MESVATTSSKVAEVVLDGGHDQRYDYAVPETLIHSVQVGSRVEVPLRTGVRKGVVVLLKDFSLFSHLKPIRALATYELSPPLLQLAEWMAKYYVTPLSRILQLFVPPVVRKEIKEKTLLFVEKKVSAKKLVELATQLRIEQKHAQAKVLDLLLANPKGVLLSQILEETQVSRSPIDTLEKQGILSLKEMIIDRSPLEDFEYFQSPAKTLSEAQKNCFDLLCSQIDRDQFSPHLLHGVTGSGKTEVYLQAIAHARSLGKGVIVLVPEVALTTQTIERFRCRFTERLGIIHHRLSMGEKADIWRAIDQGEIQIVIGARSAIFAPVKRLGLIIVDEEHDGSYKSEEMPCYHARDVSIMRAKLENAVVVLGSATPSLESYYNAIGGKYGLHTLAFRAANASFAAVHIIDMKREYEKNGGFTLFSSQLIDLLKDRLKKGEQSVLFLNRRGYHSRRVCTGCGETQKCIQCAVSLTFHRDENALRCHCCGYEVRPIPLACSYCHAEGHLTFKGYGTQQVERALYALFPDARILRMDADTTKHKGSHDLLFKQFKSGKADILLGTQMITKGLHFPSVTLVGVLSVDAHLQIPDFRSTERVFQLVTQVAGRAGRGVLPGEVLLQTTIPQHPLFNFAMNERYIDFFNDELSHREMFGYPPIARLAKLTLTAIEPQLVSTSAQTLFSHLLNKLPSTFTIYPPIQCGIEKIEGEFRMKIVIKASENKTISPFLHRLREEVSFPKEVKLHIDIDPLSLWN